jgi:hypothetical protein
MFKKILICSIFFSSPAAADPLEIDFLVQLFLHYVHPDTPTLADHDYPRPFYRSR